MFRLKIYYNNKTGIHHLVVGFNLPLILIIILYSDFKSDKYSNSITVPRCAKKDCIKYLEHVQLVLHMNSNSRGKLTVSIDANVFRKINIVVLPKH